MDNASTTTATIAKKLAEAQAEMKNASLDGLNPHFTSRYATLASIRDATVPILAKHGIALVQGTQVLDGTLVAFTRLAHGDEWYESTYPVAIEKPQQMGSAITYAKRYMLAAMCGIAAEDDDDGNAAQTSGATPKVARAKANGAGEPITAETRQQIENLFRPVEEMLSAPEKKAVTDALKGTEERGKKALSFLQDRIAELNAAAEVGA